MGEKKGRLRTIARRVEQGMAVIVVVAIIGFFAKSVGFFAAIIPMPFDPVGWREPIDIDDPNNLRSRMVDDLMTRLTPGMAKAAVGEILGPADFDGGPCDYWKLGFRGDMIDPYSLKVCYKDDLVENATLYQH